MRGRKLAKTVVGIIVLLAGVYLFAGAALAQAPFYQGKTIMMIVSTAPGGTGDLRVKAMAPVLRKHIPGNPTIAMEYMDGGGGRKAANYLFRNSRPDGLTIGALSGGIVSLEIMRESGVMYDLDKFIYLGAPESGGHYIIYTKKELGLNSIEKLRAASGLRIGAQSVGHVSYVAGRLFAYFLGLKDPKFIAGYSAPEVDAALLRGELDARANLTTSMLRRNPEWVEKGLMNFHSIMEVPLGAKHPRFPTVPEIETFARSEQEKKVLAVWRVFRLVGSPYMLPPGTPKDKVDILQDAMRKTLKDSEFHREYKKLVGDDVDPLMPEELSKAIREIPRDPEVIEMLRTLSGAGPLPARS
jgi:tripartite-type tricarboxylate transporter receptor subunit TctC